MATRQEFHTYDCSTLANFKDWAMSVGAALSAMGWIQAGSGGAAIAETSPASQVSWGSISAVPTVGGSSHVPRPSSFSFRGAWASGGTSYLGNTLDNNQNDIVTSGGITYMCVNSTQLSLSAVANAAAGNTQYTGSITNGGTNNFAGLSVVIAGFANANNNGTFTVVSNTTTTITVNNAAGVAVTAVGTYTFNTAPASDIYNGNSSSFGHWLPYYYEVWQTNDGNAPIYMRFVYASDGSLRPIFNLAVSAQLNASLFPVGNYAQFGTTPATEQAAGGNGTARGSTTFECLYAGAMGADTWFNMCLWHNATDAGAPVFIGIDRARTSTGAQVDTFFVCTRSGPSTSVNNSLASVFKTGSGSTPPLTSTGTGWTTINLSATLNMAYNGTTPALPVFPLVGFVANPILNAVVFAAGDVTDNAMASVILYGTAHSYLVLKSSNSGPFPYLQSANAVCALGMRWE